MWIISGLHVDHMLGYISGLYVDYKWVTCGLYVGKQSYGLYGDYSGLHVNDMLENNHMDYMGIIVCYM